MGLVEGKVAIVSGVGPGLGQAIARAMARDGAKVALAARNEAFLKEVEAALPDSLAVPTDITDAEQCEALVARTVEHYGGVDIVINSAFQPGDLKTFEKSDLSRWRNLFEVNTFGALQVTQAAIPAMRERGKGAVVFVNSMVIRKTGAIAEGGYAATKGALFAAARVLAHELGPHRIRVNSVVPGWMWGPNVQGYVDYMAQKRGVEPEVVKAEINAPMALPDIPTSEEVAEAVVFLASDRASAITGQTLDVNGGEYFD
ncbi:MAG TPA: SDR family oxidoreductase [Acidimicrobiales bacterium]|nr:SDR family oxidoreductase [Acidimicrobiales bacterium]